MENLLTIEPMIVVFLADKLGVVHHVELLAGEQLLAAHEAGEALEVEHLVTRLPYQVLGADPLPAPAALRSKPPANRKH